MLKTPEVAEPVSKVDDNTLMLRLQHGREDAFYELVSRYKHLMVNYLCRMIGDYDTAVDMAQEVFLRVFRNHRQYDTRLKFSTWIYRIATNLAIDEIRKRKRRSASLLTAGAIPRDYTEEADRTPPPTMRTIRNPEEQMLRREARDRILEAIDTLPEDQKHIFLLKEMEQLQLDEISRITDIKIGTLKSRLHRARQTLMERLGGYITGGIE
ncbi:MAG: sigma-70 family RNA polymerase sigma factor [Acidobacteria bacterium]|nr:sigma-70 family RNA polymerase sigma factor [Acidobacteriota bacterium]